MTMLGSAPLGMVTLSAPLLDCAVPPVVPTTVDVGVCGGFCDEPPEHRTTAATTRAPPKIRTKFELSFMAYS